LGDEEHLFDRAAARALTKIEISENARWVSLHPLGPAAGPDPRLVLPCFINGMAVGNWPTAWQLAIGNWQLATARKTTANGKI